MSEANRRAAAQMERDGIRKLSPWSKPVRQGAFTYRVKFGLPACDYEGCAKRAGYSTPLGNRCYSHARALGGR